MDHQHTALPTPVIGNRPALRREALGLVTDEFILVPVLVEGQAAVPPEEEYDTDGYHKIKHVGDSTLSGGSRKAWRALKSRVNIKA